MLNLPLDFIVLATGASHDNAVKYKPILGHVCTQFSINDKERVCAFLSQIGHESCGMSVLEENLNYSVTALSKLFSESRISPADRNKYGRIDGVQKADQVAIANLIYGGDWGLRNLGNREPGDGWKFRGKGLKQLTGRDNHKRCGDALGIDLINHPEKLLLPENAAMSAGWFWSVNKLNPIADMKDIKTLTKRINGGVFGLDNRQKLFDKAMSYDLVV